MMKRVCIVLFFNLLGLYLNAQNTPCLYLPTTHQQLQLRKFQAELDKNGIPMHKTTQYVPIKPHIIGSNAGIGYYSINNLLNTICELNTRFAPVGFYFYLADLPGYINDDNLNKGDADQIWTSAGDYKMNGAVNVFFHNSSVEGWCGVYFGGLDVVFVQNSCQQPNSTTLTHELGHFFSLPHTFYGWEGGNTPGAPEKKDKSNCRSAGDGFCDTDPDYVSSRWGCPYYFWLKDPNGVSFKPDSSMYMSYSLDNCQSRFSAEQIAAMQTDLQVRQIAKTSVDNRLLSAPQQISPFPGDTGLNPQAITLNWESIPGAFAYQIQIARFGDWQYLNFDRLTRDTSITVSLFGSWPYAWRLRAITEGNTCSQFGRVDTFVTREKPSGIITTLKTNFSCSAYPNPATTGQKINLKASVPALIEIWNSQGKLIYKLNSVEDSEWDAPAPGVYFVRFTHANASQTMKLLVQ